MACLTLFYIMKEEKITLDVGKYVLGDVESLFNAKDQKKINALLSKNKRKKVLQDKKLGVICFRDVSEENWDLVEYNFCIKTPSHVLILVESEKMSGDPKARGKKSISVKEPSYIIADYSKQYGYGIEFHTQEPAPCAWMVLQAESTK